MHHSAIVYDLLKFLTNLEGLVSFCQALAGPSLYVGYLVQSRKQAIQAEHPIKHSENLFVAGDKPATAKDLMSRQLTDFAMRQLSYLPYCSWVGAFHCLCLFGGPKGLFFHEKVAHVHLSFFPRSCPLADSPDKPGKETFGFASAASLSPSLGQRAWIQSKAKSSQPNTSRSS